VAAGQHQVVAGPLAFDPQHPAGQVDQRVEPVKHPRRPGDQLRQAIGPLDVGQLVQQDHLAAVRGPVVGLGRQHDHRPQEAAGQRDVGPGASQQRHRPSQAQVAAKAFQEHRPTAVRDASGLAGHSPDHHRADEQGHAQHQHAGRPTQKNPR